MSKCEEDNLNGTLPIPEKLALYAIKYAKKCCLLYGQTYEQISNNGKKLVDEVEKSLQVNLITMISTEVSQF